MKKWVFFAPTVIVLLLAAASSTYAKDLVNNKSDRVGSNPFIFQLVGLTRDQTLKETEDFLTRSNKKFTDSGSESKAWIDVIYNDVILDVPCNVILKFTEKERKLRGYHIAWEKSTPIGSKVKNVLSKKIGTPSTKYGPDSHWEDSTGYRIDLHVLDNQDASRTDLIVYNPSDDTYKP